MGGSAILAIRQTCPLASATPASTESTQVVVVWPVVNTTTAPTLTSTTWVTLVRSVCVTSTRTTTSTGGRSLTSTSCTPSSPRSSTRPPLPNSSRRKHPQRRLRQGPRQGPSPSDPDDRQGPLRLAPRREEDQGGRRCRQDHRVDVFLPSCFRRTSLFSDWREFGRLGEGKCTSRTCLEGTRGSGPFGDEGRGLLSPSQTDKPCRLTVATPPNPPYAKALADLCDLSQHPRGNPV